MEELISLYQREMARLASVVKNNIPLVKGNYSQHLLLLAPETRGSIACLTGKGLARQYYRDTEGNQIVTGFWRMGEVMLQPENFLLEVEAAEYIELLEESELEMFSLSDLLAAETGKGLHLKEMIVHTYRLRKQLHAELKNQGIASGLYYLNKLYPLSRITRKDIASYLNKAPGSISRGKRQE